MTDVEVSIWFRWESCPNLAASHREMLLSQIRSDLWITAGFVQSAQKPLLEYGLGRRLLNGFRGRCFRCRLLHILQQRLVWSLGIERLFSTLAFSAFSFARASSLLPKVSTKTFSTVFFSSSGLAHRRSGVFFKPPITELRLAHPEMAFAEM